MNPANKFADLLILHQASAISSDPRQLCIAEVLVDCLVTDRMNRNRLPALFRFGDRVMPLNARFKGAAAQPAAMRQLAHLIRASGFEGEEIIGRLDVRVGQIIVDRIGAAIIETCVHS